MSGLGTASVVLGGIALLLAPVPLLNVIGAAGALVGVVLGVIGLVQRGRRRPTADVIGVPSLGPVARDIRCLDRRLRGCLHRMDPDTLEQDDGCYLITEQEPIVFEDPGSTEPADAGVGLSP